MQMSSPLLPNTVLGVASAGACDREPRSIGGQVVSLEEASLDREGVGVETVALVADCSEKALGASELAIGGSDLEVKVGCS